MDEPHSTGGKKESSTRGVSRSDAARALEVQVEPGVFTYDSESWSGAVR
ncbi:hypothetical protein ABZ921_11840 [Streptomyces atriruber]|uniref:DUF397 domain-containing protein n=1 Tax=Streptomyces atriruber TaxID=545121 RepID=A0ABV3BJY5_9ACTN